MILFNCWSVNNMTVGRSLQTTSRIKPGKVVFCSSTTDASGSFFTLSDGFWVRYSICFVYRGSELMAWVSITPPASFLANNKTKFLSFLYNFQLGTLFRPDMWHIGWGTIAMLFDLKSRGRTIKNYVLWYEHRGKTNCAWAQNLTSGQFLFPVWYINQLRKRNIAVAPSLKAKREKQTKKGAEKITSFESLYIFLASNFCTTWLSVCTNGENDVWSLQVASARQDEFVFTGFLACYWFGIS